MRLNAYRIMWLFVFFDLPTSTKKERKKASKFRKNLLDDGFNILFFFKRSQNKQPIMTTQK